MKEKIVFVIVFFGLIFFFIIFFQSQLWGDEHSLGCKLESQITDQDTGNEAIFSESGFMSGRRGD